MSDTKLKFWERMNFDDAVFPMWDRVGGRISECLAAGLLSAALQRFEIQ
jgi:glucose-6-phosphate isomerase